MPRGWKTAAFALLLLGRRFRDFSAALNLSVGCRNQISDMSIFVGHLSFHLGVASPKGRRDGPFKAIHAPVISPTMGFNRRKMEDRRRQAAEQEAAARRATEKQILEDADHLITVWNERQAKRMPMLFSPTIGAAITAGYWFLRARCPACRTTGDVELGTLDWHHGAAVTALTPALSCRSCRPNAPFAELVCLSKTSLAEDYHAERSGNRWVSE
jgi:hypothetical protein